MSQGMPGWVKALLIGGAAIAGIVVVGEVIYSTVTAPINTYKQLLTQQYSDFLKKIAGYTASNPNGYTPAQQQSISYETTIMGQTAQGLANTSKNLTDLGALAIEVFALPAIIAAIGVAVAVVAPRVIGALRSKAGKPIQTAYGMDYAAVISFAEALAENGFPIEATNIMNSSQTIFQTYDQAAMQQSINSLNALIPTLTGTELYIAQLQVEALTFEMSIIPEWLALPLPLV